MEHMSSSRRPAVAMRIVPGVAPCILLVIPLLGSFFAAVAAPAPAAAQSSCRSMAQCSALRPPMTTEQEARVVAANVLLGSATAVVVRIARGESLRDALFQGAPGGALGGGLVYLGKRVAVEEFDGAGLLGRQLAGVGGSVVRNVTGGRGALDEVVLAAGPVRLYVGRDGRLTPRLDLATMIVAGAFVVAHDARLDAGASLSSGSLVFRGGAPMPGLTSAGATLLWRELPTAEAARLMAHERVHILQYDQSFLSWGEPAERWLGERSGLHPSLLRHVDIGGVVLGVRAGLGLTMDYHDRPWEHEAYFLAERAHPVPDHLGHVH